MFWFFFTTFSSLFYGEMHTHECLALFLTLFCFSGRFQLGWQQQLREIPMACSEKSHTSGTDAWKSNYIMLYIIHSRLTSAAVCPPDWRLYPEDPVHAARPSDHIPPQPAAWKCCGLLQFKRRGRQSPEEPAHVRTTHTHTLSSPGPKMDGH